MIHATPLLLALALAVGMGNAAQAKELRELTQEIKKPMTIQGGKSEKMSVVFNHTSHTGIACLLCHHKREGENRFVPCVTCHTEPGARARDAKSMFMAYHSRSEADRSCYACHTQRAVKAPERYGTFFTGCRPCHMTPTAKESSASAAAAKAVREKAAKD